MTASGGVADPFGLRSLRVEDLERRPGVKWQRDPGRLAAWVADMDFPVAPAVRDALVELATTDVGYPNWPRTGARSPLPERFAARMSDRFGWEPGQDRLHELADVIQGVRIAIHHLTEPGDGIVLHTPAYPPFLASIRRAGRRLVDVPWPFDLDAVEDRLQVESARMLLLCHPHNPTGEVFDRSTLERLAELAARFDLVVVSDEIHADLVHAPHHHVPFASLGADVEARTITVTSASKAFNLAGLRWAVAHAGSDVLQRSLADLPEHYLGAPNVMAVAATEAAWRDGDAWLNAVLAQLDENRRLLGDLLAHHLPDVGYRPPDATYLAWLDARRLDLGDDPAEEFRRRGVELSPGPTFGPQGRGFVRLNFATSPDILRRIVVTMAEDGVGR